MQDACTASAVAVAVDSAVAVAAADAAAELLLLLVHARVRQGSVQNVVHVGVPWLSMRTTACVLCWGFTEAYRRLASVRGCKVGSLSRQRALAGRPGPLGGERGRCRRSGT